MRPIGPISFDMMIKFLKFLLLFTALTPLVYTPQLIYPFVLGKALFFRVIIEAALILFLIALVINQDLRRKLVDSLKNPLAALLVLFFISAGVSTLVAVNPYRSFWGEVERMEGLFGLLHYLVFFLIAITLFDKRDWERFVKVSLITGLIIAFYGLLQFFGVTEFPLAFPQRARPDAFLGNPSFLGAHFVFLGALAAFLFLKESQKAFWRYFSLLILVVSLITVFLSGTRGAIVSLASGLIFLLAFVYHLGWRRKLLIGALAVIVVALVGFWLTRHQPLWQTIPGVNRFARLGFDSPTVRTRLLAIQVAGEAIKEKPIFGWGIDNLNVGYNKHFNPDYSLYEAAWFDRAHNKLLDVGVMQGLVGLLLYLSVWVLVFYYLFKYPDWRFKLPLLLLLVMYFVQNLFVFDQINSYLMSFTVLGIAAGAIPDRLKIDDWWFADSWRRFLAVGLAVVLALLLFYLLYFYNFVPARQAFLFNKTRNAVRDVQLISQAADRFLAPYNFAQNTIRAEFMDFLLETDAFKKKEFEFMTSKSLLAVEELIKREPYEPKMFIRLSEAYNDLGRSQPEFFEKSEKVLRQAIELSPQRQDIYYHLAYTLVAQGKKDEAVAVARQAVNLNSAVGRAHYILGVILSLAGERYRVEGEQAIERAFTLKGLFLEEQDYKNLETIFRNGLLYHLRRREAEPLVKIAKRFREIKPAIADELTVIISLAEKGDWLRLDSLLGLR